MKGWLSRWWARPFPPPSAVADDRFQEPDEPYPGHWRELPARWPSDGGPNDPVVAEQLRAGLAELPARWREVVLRRDVSGGRPTGSARERAILNLARAALRERLARLPRRGAE